MATWTNKINGQENIGKKLDHFLDKESFLDHFQRYKSGVFASSGFNHATIILEGEPTVVVVDQNTPRNLS